MSWFLCAARRAVPVPTGGTPAADPEATRIARAQSAVLTRKDEADELEHTIFTVRPTLIFVKAGYVAAVLGGIGLTILLAMINVPFYISVPVALALLLIPAFLSFATEHGSLYGDRRKAGDRYRTDRAHDAEYSVEQGPGCHGLSQHSPAYPGFWRPHRRQRQ